MSPCSKNFLHSHHTLADKVIKIICLKSNKNLYSWGWKNCSKNSWESKAWIFLLENWKVAISLQGGTLGKHCPFNAPLLKHFDMNSSNLCYQVVTLHRSYTENVLDITRRIFPGRFRKKIWPSLLPVLPFCCRPRGSGPLRQSHNGG